MLPVLCSNSQCSAGDGMLIRAGKPIGFSARSTTAERMSLFPSWSCESSGRPLVEMISRPTMMPRRGWICRNPPAKRWSDKPKTNKNRPVSLESVDRIGCCSPKFSRCISSCPVDKVKVELTNPNLAQYKISNPISH